MTEQQKTIARPFLQSMPLVILAGSLIAMINFGPRSAMGLFLTPISNEFGWDREIFALAIAFQSLAWGAGQPIAGMLADRFGVARVLIGGAAIYAVGLALMATTSDPVELQFTAGLLIGLGVAGSAFLVVLAAFARLLPENMRTIGYGVATAAGSLGQFLFAPLGQSFIAAYGWQTTLLILAVFVMTIPLFAFVLRGKPDAAPVAAGQDDQSMWQALREAFGHTSYRLLVSGFFVCGFQVAFITVHLPPYLGDIGVPAIYGGYAIGLIGLFNIFGSITSGVLTGLMSRRIILAGLYLARSLIILVFLLVPVSVVSVLVFSAAIGFLWLSTVPPTQQLVVIMFGTRYVATLFGFVFFSHQVGSFLGIWLGGRLYDTFGSYDGVWWISIALGVFAALAHIPIVERAIDRPAAARAA
ncbi:MAG: MFS transporter [Alphaproteobacteria bacterium]